MTEARKQKAPSDGPRRKLILQGPVYLSEGDETAFFNWLQSIPCVREVQGQLRELHIDLARSATIADLQELSALLRRYRIGTEVLSHLRTGKNAKWFEDQALRDNEDT